MSQKLILTSIFFTLLPLTVISQNVLEKYVNEGIENNLSLQEKNISLEQSLLALETAKSYFLPAVDFGFTYNLSKGGRSIQLPIGDLLNDVYSTLNDLTSSDRFPLVENVSQQFLPNNFYDARFRITLPVVNPDLHFQKEIREQQVIVSELDLEIYRATLIEDIKTAYYNYCTAFKAIEVLESSAELVQRNLKDNQSLLENGKGLPASVLRAESEVENIRALMIEAENRKLNASYYLNFLLNKPLDSEVIYESQDIDQAHLQALLIEDNLDTRPELLQVSTLQQIRETSLLQSKRYWVPRINTFADLGSQEFNFEFSTQNSAYAFFGLNLNFPIFHGGRNQQHIRLSELNLVASNLQKNQLENKLSMDLKMAKNAVISSQAALKSSEKKLTSSEAYLRLVDRGFREGANSLIEFIDARNQYTQASLQQTINTYSLLISQTKLERQLTIDNY